MGIGRATGENRAEDAAKQAIQSPLLETSIEGAKRCNNQHYRKCKCWIT